MRIIYRANLKRPIFLDDHWPIPIMGGEFRLIAEKGRVNSIEFAFSGQPTTLAPKIETLSAEKISTQITGRDTLYPFVRMQLEGALSFLQCYFDIEVAINEINISYVGESEEEESQIPIKSMCIGTAGNLAVLTYDFITRAVMAAETNPAPAFEATLAGAARKAMVEKKYIDSFRYSFLLIEAKYGDGKFKTVQLQDALKSDEIFREIVNEALLDLMEPKRRTGSPTEKLLASAPTSDQVIDHLVEMRGFYFHGNLKRSNAWKPQDQQEAEALCLLALGIVMGISHRAADPMFADDLSLRHFENAKKAGAIMTLRVNYEYREPAENMNRAGVTDINVPGTKATPKMAKYVAQKFLEEFENSSPSADLRAATCSVRDTGQPVFEIKIYAESEN